MLDSLVKDIEIWEDDGGRTLPPLAPPAVSLTGTPNQVEWAERIRNRVNGDFDRVARSFRVVALKQNARKRAETEAILAILEEKRDAVMKREQAAYFILDWQDTSDQVRRMIGQDSRFQAIKNSRSAANELTGSRKVLEK